MDEGRKAGDRLAIGADGTISVGAFELPLSAALSEQSKARFGAMFSTPEDMGLDDPAAAATESEFKAAVDALRQKVDQAMARPAAERLLANFPVEITPDRIGGVSVEVFAPHEGLDEERVLINLHGGRFYAGAIYNGRMESIPVAHMGRLRVVSVDYRQGYEHRFPAASEDVAAVYAAMLRNYEPGQIGIYGASAGGMLTAQATAWILQNGLPAPGAIGIFSAGTGGAGDGDFFAAVGTGKHPPHNPMSSLTAAQVGYFAGARADDPLVNPNIAPEAFRARFPPTLLITGTRAFDFSPALATHRALCQAGVEASLHVFDGLGHGFFYGAGSPEAVDAHQMMVRFFRQHLAR